MGAAQAYNEGTNTSDGAGGYYLQRVECDINVSIMLRHLCNLDTKEPHYCITKLEFEWIYIIFALKHKLWVLARTASMRQV